MNIKMTFKVNIAVTALAGLILLSGCDGLDEEYLERAEITSRNIDLVEAAHAGNVEATNRLIACIQGAEPWSQQNMQIYYWLVRLDAAGVTATPINLDDMAGMLEEKDKEFVSMWLDEFPDIPMMPFVTEINCFENP